MACCYPEVDSAPLTKGTPWDLTFNASVPGWIHDVKNERVNGC